MTTQFLKTVFAGILAAFALFMLPFFLLRVFFFFCIIGAIFRLLGGRRRHRYGGMHPAFAHRFQQMSDDEKAAFKQRYNNHCCYHPFEEKSDRNETSSNNPL